MRVRVCVCVCVRALSVCVCYLFSSLHKYRSGGVAFLNTSAAFFKESMVPKESTNTEVKESAMQRKITSLHRIILYVYGKHKDTIFHFVHILQRICQWIVVWHDTNTLYWSWGNTAIKINSVSTFFDTLGMTYQPLLCLLRSARELQLFLVPSPAFYSPVDSVLLPRISSFVSHCQMCSPCFLETSWNGQEWLQHWPPQQHLFYLQRVEMQ